MKTQFFTRASIARGAAALLILPFQMLPVAEGSTQPQDIEVEDIARLCVRVNKIGATGIGKVIGTEGETRYEIDGSELKVYLAPVDRLGEMTVVVDGTYGEIKLHEVVFVDVKNDAESEVEISPYIFSAIAAGGGGDYKTDIYMDGSGRIILERLEDGSTIVSDEHENTILKRNADGSTQYFDAYQSARLLIDADGVVSVNYNEDETVKTLQLAEAIMARTRKRLLTNTAGEETIKDEEGNILTHAQIYEMLMTSPDFVVLVRSDHAFHPNLVTETQIAFTCSYLGADGKISAERVNITSANVVTYSQGKGVTAGANGGVTIGFECQATGNNSFASGIHCVASGENSRAEGSGSSPYPLNASGACSHAEGVGTRATAYAAHAEGFITRATSNYSHAEGQDTTASGSCSHAEGISSVSSGMYSHAEGSEGRAVGRCSHAEGEYSFANGGTSHAEGYQCQTGTNGGSAHAEGSFTNANAAASHTEGYRTITTEGGSHAQGCWNKVEGGQYAFMHGCGTSEEDRKNAFLISGEAIYILGIGGYDGTNADQEGVQSLQEYLLSLNQ